MGRRFAVLVAGSLLVAVAGCSGGGDGGNESAFCDDLEALSDQVADGDLASTGGLGDAVDTVNSLVENASGDQADAVREVGELLADEDTQPEDAADTAEAIQDELGDIAEEVCGIDNDEFAIAPDETTVPDTEPEETTVPDTEPEDTVVDDTEPADGQTVAARQPVPADLEPEFIDLANACFANDFAACDELFNTTPSGSVAEGYGDTCAGRIEDGQGFDFECVTLVAAASPPPADVADQANGQACFGGDMAACDALLSAGEGTPDLVYGFFCGGRLNAEVVGNAALCVDVFGPTAA